MESEVETALELLLEEGVVPTCDRVKALVVTAEAELPDLAVPEVSLEVYDALLEGASEVAS
jgi:hypothetical protein